jgi:hypothetical protein
MLTASAAYADGTGAEARPPMPEPVFNETTTDIDGTEAGEVEVELNASRMRALKGLAATTQGSVEVEWLFSRRFGLRVEPNYARTTSDAGKDLRTGPGVEGSVSWKLLQDFRHEFHLQAELGARFPADDLGVVSPGEPALPYSLDLRSAFRAGWLVLRGAIGAEAGGMSARVPARASLALMSGFDAAYRAGFWGIEVEADGARSTPALIAFDLVPNLAPLGVPFRLAFAVPWAPGSPATQPSLGFFVRLLIESARESDYARSGLAAPPAP